MPVPVANASARRCFPVAFSQFTVGTFADAVGKACRGVLGDRRNDSLGAAPIAGRGRPSRTRPWRPEVSAGTTPALRPLEAQRHATPQVFLFSERPGSRPARGARRLLERAGHGRT